MLRIGLASLLTIALVASPVSAQSGALTAEQRVEGEALVQKAGRIIAITAREPLSLAFRNVHIQRRTPPSGGREPLTVCGEVNGRNGYGGFTGFQPFILVGERVYVGSALGLPVSGMCRRSVVAIDNRDYAPEIKAAADATVGN